MTKYATDSGIAITDVRVSNFRSLANIEVELDDLTVLMGSNNAGKTSFLDAFFAAIGAGRKSLVADDVRVAPGEDMAPRSRQIIVDVRIRPIGTEGKVTGSFPAGSFWTALWGTSIVLDDDSFDEFIGIRTTLSWNEIKGDYITDRRALNAWPTFDDWLDAPPQEKQLTAAQLEPVALHYIDAKRDLEDDLRKQGSFWRKMTDDLGLDPADITELEEALSGINQKIVDKSEILQHLKANLSDLQFVVASDSAGIDISPVARRLRDLSKGVDVSFSTTGAQSFPLSRHGMGTRSLASLLVFRAFAEWRNLRAAASNDKLHSILALEEPESHLHPQAQRSLYSHIKAISGQRVVSTHSPYFAGQAELDQLRLFIKSGGDTVVTRLDLTKLTKDDDKRKLRDVVIESRGDILFSRAIVLFEGQSEEQALPVWAEAYWGASIHALGLSFARVNGTDYFPFIWLAKNLSIPWYVLADGEAKPVKELEAALRKADESIASECPNVVVIPNGKNFETQLTAEGYQDQIEIALNTLSDSGTYLTDYMQSHHGQKAKGGVLRDYTSVGGQERAMADAMAGEKTKLARPLALAISSMENAQRRFPTQVKVLFEIIGQAHGLVRKED